MKVSIIAKIVLLALLVSCAKAKKADYDSYAPRAEVDTSDAEESEGEVLAEDAGADYAPSGADSAPVPAAEPLRSSSPGRRKQLKDSAKSLSQGATRNAKQKSSKLKSPVKFEDQLIEGEVKRPEMFSLLQKQSEKKLQAPPRESYGEEVVANLGDSDERADSEEYEQFQDNEFQKVTGQGTSTFSIDVDTASYANLRRMLTQGALPPKHAVRIEELINYFPYRYKAPEGKEPLAVYTDAYKAPWNPQHQLLRVGIKGKDLRKDDLKPSNLVFLIDVSGSMEDHNKLPLLKSAFRKLVENLDGRDRVSIVVYAGASGVVLDSTSADSKSKIMAALDKLQAGGSTNGADGIQLAYQIAQKNFLRDGNNRVILATDGDWNVGLTSHDDLVNLIKRKADGGVFLTVLGFGMGNYKDAMLEKISKNGSGNYYYIDSVREAEKVLVNQLSSTLFTIAKDVKIQIEFNPDYIDSYRLIGYENRLLDHQDFDDDRKDAGEIGAGFTVTALYELVPTNKNSAGQKLLNVKLRYKRPEDQTSQLREFGLKNEIRDIASASEDMRFAAAVAEYGMILRGSPHKGNARLEDVLALASNAKGHDDGGYRAEFVALVRKTMELNRRGIGVALDN